MTRLLLITVIFAIVSGLYWGLVGQILPIVAPMMLDHGPLLLRMLAHIAVALLIYVTGAVLFFRWLISQAKTF